jgi:CobQ-like glutamine amidotransferase family enzyme
MGNNGTDKSEGAVTGTVFGSYLHGPVLPANPSFADALIRMAVERALGEPFVPAEIDDGIADQARTRQVRRLIG